MTDDTPAQAIPASDVFVSYASQDTAVADAMVEALEKGGIRCWIAPRDVRAGAHYADAIVRAISGTKAFVLVLSEHAIESSHVIREIERASSKKRPIIALRTDTASLTPEFEYFLSQSQWVEAQSGKLESAYVKLVEAIRAPDQAGPSSNSRAIPGLASANASPAQSRSHRTRRLLVAGFAVLALLLAGLWAGQSWLARHAAPVAPQSTTIPVAAVVPDKSVAVLPFVDMSEQKDQEFLADGMAEELIDLLAKVPDLHIPARTSSFFFKGKATKIPDIAHELNVANVIEGSIRRSGNQLRVTAQLVRADTGYHVWSETYDRNLHDVFKVQDDIANSIVQALQISLMGGPLTRQKGGTQNLEAYQLFLRAKSAETRGTNESFLTAREQAERAITLDPGFALAQTELGFIFADLAQTRALPTREGYERARQLAQHALQLSPELADAHILLAYIHRTYDWDWAAAQSEARQALELDPNNADVLLTDGQVSATLGHWVDAERQLRAALMRDPLNAVIQWQLAKTLYRAGHFADAEAAYHRLFKLSPEFSSAHVFLGKTLLAAGKPEAALAMAQQEVVEGDRMDLLPIFLLAAGRHADADAALRVLTSNYADTDAYFIALNYAYRNDRDLALQWFERAYQQKDIGFVDIVGEPLTKNLANEPRYKAFLRKMNLPE